MTTRNRIKTVLTLSALAVSTFAITSSPAQAALFGQLGILNGGADLTGQINPATGAPWQAGDTYRFIFTSSIGRDALSADIAVYNTWVQDRANASGLNIGAAQGVTWTALASTPTVDAIDNTGLTGVKAESFWLLNGTKKIANDYTDFWDGHTGAENIDISETGGVPFDGGDFQSVWTGSDSGGLGFPNDQLGAGDGDSHTGLWCACASAAQWINRFTVLSVDDKALYGVSEPLTVFDPNPIPEPSTFALAALGLLGLVACGWRRRRTRG